jgi:hypothetical protein
MQKFVDTITYTNSRGFLAVSTGAEVAVYDKDNGALAAIFDDDEVTLLANPLPADASGMVQFKLDNGKYKFVYTDAAGLNVIVDDVVAYDDGGVSYRTTFPQPERGPSVRVTDFQAGHGWTIGGTGTGTLTDDDDTFALGTQSLKLVTAGFTSTGNRAVKTGLNINLVDKTLIYMLRVDDWSTMGNASFTLKDSHGTAVQLTDRLSGVSAIAQNGEWFEIAIPAQAFKVSNSALDLTSIVEMWIGTQSTVGTGPTTFWMQAIDIIQAPKTGCVILRLDDGYKGNRTHVKPILDKYDFRAIVFPIIDLIEGNTGSKIYMTKDQLKELVTTSKWEIGVHAYYHEHHNAVGAFTAFPVAEILTDLRKCKKWLFENELGFGEFLAWPQGIFSVPLLQGASPMFDGIFCFRGSLQDSDIWPFGDTKRIRGPAMSGAPYGVGGDSASAIINQLDLLMAAGQTIVLAAHNPTTPNSDECLGSDVDFNIATYEAVIDHIAAMGYPVKTPSEVFKNGVQPLPAQSITGTVSTVVACSTAIPSDDTTPQNTEGTQVATVTIPRARSMK